MVPEVCGVQVAPPSVVTEIRPPSPTIQPVLGLAISTSSQVTFCAAVGCRFQVVPSVVA